MILLCHGWHTGFNNKARKLEAEGKQASVTGIRGANLQRRCRALLSEKQCETFCWKWRHGGSCSSNCSSGGVIPLQFSFNFHEERPQETPSWLSWLGLSTWVLDDLFRTCLQLVAQVIIHWHRLYAFFAHHILASSRGSRFFCEPWRYSCLAEIALDILFQAKKGKKRSSVINSSAFSGPENNTDIEQLHLKTKCF